MALEVAAILIVTAGLTVQERGMMLAASDFPFISDAGERAAGFGMLITVCALPWVAIGFAVAHLV